MRHLFAVAALLFSFSTFAAPQTWTMLDPVPRVWSTSGEATDFKRSVKGACASGTCDAPTLATQGMNLKDVATVEVYVCAADAQTITDGDGFDVYFYDAAVAKWGKSDIVFKAVTGGQCSYARAEGMAKGLPILAPRGRIAVVPNAAVASSGGIDVYILATDLAGRVL